eukprot:gene32549-50514_t
MDPHGDAAGWEGLMSVVAEGTGDGSCAAGEAGGVVGGGGVSAAAARRASAPIAAAAQRRGDGACGAAVLRRLHSARAADAAAFPGVYPAAPRPVDPHRTLLGAEEAAVPAIGGVLWCHYLQEGVDDRGWGC